MTAQSGQAATIVVNHVLDPAKIGPAVFQDSLATPFTAGVGDTIEYHLTFTTGSATVVGESYFWLVSLTSGGAAAVDTFNTWTFLNPSANLVGGPFTYNEQSSFAHVGGTLFSGNYRLDSAPITFSGIDLTVEITGVTDLDYEPDGIIDGVSEDPRDYFSIALYANTPRAPAVPEPATWAMMIGGFALAGGALRRRTAARFA